jgi:hypothetical protein
MILGKWAMCMRGGFIVNEGGGGGVEAWIFYRRPFLTTPSPEGLEWRSFQQLQSFVRPRMSNTKKKWQTTYSIKRLK